MTAKDVMLSRKLGGGGFEYDFIIKSTDGGETLTLETGTYESINAKLGNQPLNGKIILTDGLGYIADMNCILVVNDGKSLMVCGYMEYGNISLTINADNTVTVKT